MRFVVVLSSVALGAACAPSGQAPEEIPNAGKADQAALILTLAESQPIPLYLECAAPEGCDISFAASLRAPSLCELAPKERDCGLDPRDVLELPLATISVETPAGEVHERVITATARGSEDVRVTVRGERLREQPAGMYFVDIIRDPDLEGDPEIAFEASYGATGAGEPAAPCELGLPEHVATELDGDRRWVALRWTSGDDAWFEPEGEGLSIPDDSLLGRYREEVVSAGISPDPLELLRRQRALYERAFPDAVPTYDAILDGELGSIGVVECWEAAVMEDHLRRHIEQDVPNEFQAFLLTRDDDGQTRARIYGVSGNMTWAPRATPLWDQIEADLAAGWEMRSHLHNHFFFLSHLPDGDIAGTLIPSPPDRNSYVSHAERFDLAEARITNAFDTIRFSQAEFSELVRLLESP